MENDEWDLFKWLRSLKWIIIAWSFVKKNLICCDLTLGTWSKALSSSYNLSLQVLMVWSQSFQLVSLYENDLHFGNLLWIFITIGCCSLCMLWLFTEHLFIRRRSRGSQMLSSRLFNHLYFRIWSRLHLIMFKIRDKLFLSDYTTACDLYRLQENVSLKLIITAYLAYLDGCP